MSNEANAPEGLLGSEKQTREDIREDWLNLPTIVASLLYLIAVTLSLSMMIPIAIRHGISTEFIGVLISLVTVLPLALTVGVFAAYRSAYQRGGSVDQPDTASLGEALKKALAWRRYALPLSFLNLLITFFVGFLLYEDIRYTPSEGGVLLGAFSVPLNFGDTLLSVPTSLFYWAYAGFFVYTLEATRRRYITKNLVPHFYVSSAFRWVYASIAVVLVYFAVQLGVDMFSFSETLSGIMKKPEFLTLLAFAVGMSPIQMLNPVATAVRSKFGIPGTESLPLSLIDGIDHTLEAFLQEENVDSFQALATENASLIAKRTKIPEDTIKDWQEQARLLNVLGDVETINRFRRLGFREITDLKVLLDEVDLSGKGKLSVEDLTKALSVKDNKEAKETPETWGVLIRILRQEYEKYLAQVKAEKKR